MQFKTWPQTRVTVGGTVSLVTVAEAEAVQPLLPVAVTLNVPALLTVIEEPVAPLLHRSVAPEEAVAVRTAEVVVQFKTWFGPNVTVGGTVSLVTETSPKQVLALLAGSVMV